MGALCCCTLAKGMRNAYDAVIPQVLCVVFYKGVVYISKQLLMDLFATTTDIWKTSRRDTVMNVFIHIYIQLVRSISTKLESDLRKRVKLC